VINQLDCASAMPKFDMRSQAVSICELANLMPGADYRGSVVRRLRVAMSVRWTSDGFHFEESALVGCGCHNHKLTTLCNFLHDDAREPCRRRRNSLRKGVAHDSHHLHFTDLC
jgi:hypothetical protein